MAGFEEWEGTTYRSYSYFELIGTVTQLQSLELHLPGQNAISLLDACPKQSVEVGKVFDDQLFVGPCTTWSALAEIGRRNGK